MIVQSQLEINKESNIVIDLIKSKSNLEKFHPFCKKNIVVKWKGKNSEDIVIYHNNKQYVRKFTEWHQSGYKLEIFEDRKLADISWNVKDLNNKSIIKITAKPYLPYKYRFINVIVFNLYVKYVLQSYLNSVVKGLKYYLENNKTVSDNQFGKHIWYS
tara:strand:- start:1902 stop:2375 length:474 start_codon:yes stop_codon:yes gene_type:complete